MPKGYPLLVQAIELTNEKYRSEFLKEVKIKDSRKALEEYFGVIIVEIKDETVYNSVYLVGVTFNLISIIDKKIIIY